MPARIAVFGSRSDRSWETDSFCLYEKPRSPCSVWLSQSQYCTGSGLVEPVLLVELGDRVVRRPLAEDRTRRTAGQLVEHHEDDHGHEQQHDDRLERCGE